MSNTKPKPFAFVLMPFAEEFDDVYNLGIVAACKEAGAYCERVDRQIFTGSILERIYNQISKADIIIADMTGRNANVFYEVGYAHAIGQRTILMTRIADDIPFDLKHYSHIVYGSSVKKLRDDLKKHVKYFIAHPDRDRIVSPRSFTYYIDGIEIEHIPVVRVDVADPIRAVNGQILPQNWELSFALHNSGDTTVKLGSMQFGVVFPSELSKPSLASDRCLKIPDGKFMYLSHSVYGEVLPKGWHNETISLSHGNPSAVRGKVFQCQVRIVSEVGLREIPFSVHVNQKQE